MERGTRNGATRNFFPCAADVDTPFDVAGLVVMETEVERMGIGPDSTRDP